MATPTPTAAAAASTSCINVTPGKNGYVPEYACNANYNYDPSFAAALIFAILFGITTFLHIYQAITYKKLRVCWVIIMGSAWEFASFTLRTAGTRNQQSQPLAYASQILVLLAPMWVNAFDYMVVGRMIYFFVPDRQIWGIKGIKITKIFVWLDVLSFLTQVAGGTMISPGNSAAAQMNGIHIYMGGIGLQQLSILFFSTIVLRFHHTMRQHERHLTDSPNRIISTHPQDWRNLLYVLIASLLCITTRIIFRMVEFSSGLDPAKNPIPFHEAYFLCLDALPMFFAVALMNVVHPGMVLRGEGSEFPKGPTWKEKRALKRVRKEEKRAEKAERKAKKVEMKAVEEGKREMNAGSFETV